MRFKTILGLCAIALTVSGCGHLNSIGRRYSVDLGESLSIDAKQRTIYTITKKFADGKEWRAVCAEPSPDALAAISASAGLSVEQMQQAISGAFSSQESAASIGLRTQTIQILRDAMYRLCEGYASGALDEIGFTRLQRRYQNIMLGLLAIEQLTGAVVAKQVILTGSADASVARTLAEIQAQIDDAKTAKRNAEDGVTKTKADNDAADAAVTKADAEYKKLVTDNGGKEDADPVKKFKSETLDPARKKAAAAKESLEKTQRVLKDASDTVVALEEIRKDLGKVASRATTRGEFGGGGHISVVNAQTASTISSTVKDIVLGIVNKDYARETCLDAVLSRQFRVLYSDQFRLAVLFCSMTMQTEILELSSRLKGLPGKEADAVRNQLDAATSTARKIEELVGTLTDPQVELEGKPKPEEPKAKP